MAASPLPLSARDLIEFRPASAAAIAAREALEAAQTALAASPPDDDATPLQAAVAAARAVLDTAEAAAAVADPVFVLRVPTGRTKALVNHAVNADPDAPRFRDNAALLEAITAEAAAAGVSDEDLAALAEAGPIVAAGDTLAADLWTRLLAAAQATPTGRAIIADRVLYGELQARHRVARHLVLPGRKSPLAERDLDGLALHHLRAINAELERLSELTEADAKNSAAP